MAIRVRDELGEVWSDERFRGLFGVRGKPGISPAQLMIVLVLAVAENLTDRQAADMARRAIDWKYALGLALDDPGFDLSVLSEFRARLVAGSMETEALDALLVALAGLGLIRSGGRQRSDSTHVLGRLRSLNRLELAGESVRATLEALAAAAPTWLATVIDQEWAQVYGSRIDNLHLPASDTKRTALALAYGRDGYRLLDAVSATGAPPWLRELPGVQTLRRIWIQQYYRVIDDVGGEKVIRRESEQGLPPGRSKLVSPYDLDARYDVGGRPRPTGGPTAASSSPARPVRRWSRTTCAGAGIRCASGRVSAASGSTLCGTRPCRCCSGSACRHTSSGTSSDTAHRRDHGDLRARVPGREAGRAGQVG